MAGMEALGRVCNVVASADNKPFRVDLNSGVMFVAVASSTATTSLTFTAATTFSGSYTNWTTANSFAQPDHWYQQTVGDGTVAWTKQTASWSSNVLTIGATSGYVSVVHIFGSHFADTYKYINCDATNASLTAVIYDLTVQRKPANLTIVGA